MKKSISVIISMIFALVCVLGFNACSEAEDSTTDVNPTPSPQPAPEPEEDEAGIPDVPSGDYMTMTDENIIIHVDKENGKAAMISWEDYDYYLLTGTSGDLVNNDYVWAYSPSQGYVKFTSSIDAYKFQYGFPSAFYYVYNNGSRICLSKELSEDSMDTKNLVLLTDTIKAEWEKPADGTWVSGKISMNGEDKYLYAVVSDSASTIKFYLEGSTSISDFSSLSAYETFEEIYYSFIPHELIYEENGLRILYSKKFFKVKKDGVFDSVSLTKK